MEIPCLFFAVFSAYYLIERKIAAASLMAILSSLVKAPGGLAAAAVFIITFFELFDRQNKNRFKNFIYGLLAFILGIAQLILMRIFVNAGSQQPPAGTIQFFVGWLPLVVESRSLTSKLR